MTNPTSKKPSENLSPSDFYSFRHRTVSFINPQDPKRSAAWEMPLWIVGASPFDTVLAPDQGHIVHLAEPRFIARWIKGDIGRSDVDPTKQMNYYDEGLDILIYEISWLDKDAKNIEDWLLEAAAAVAYTQGNLAELEPPAEH
jgi:hypothetical protein